MKKKFLKIFVKLYFTDACVNQDSQEKIVSQGISHAHHHHAKMEEHANKRRNIRMSVNVHQVSVV